MVVVVVCFFFLSFALFEGQLICATKFLFIIGICSQLDDEATGKPHSNQRLIRIQRMLILLLGHRFFCSCCWVMWFFRRHICTLRFMSNQQNEKDCTHKHIIIYHNINSMHKPFEIHKFLIYSTLSHVQTIRFLFILRANRMFMCICLISLKNRLVTDPGSIWLMLSNGNEWTWKTHVIR